MLKQEYTSENTSISVINAIYKQFHFPKNSHILDYGGGKYDLNKKYMKEHKKCDLKVFDPYNRSPKHNEQVLKYFSKNSPDFIICSNVLNVIKEQEVIQSIINDIYTYSHDKTEIIFAIYEGNKSGIHKITSKGFQRNEKRDEYIKYIKEKFIITRKFSNFIVCTKK